MTHPLSCHPTVHPGVGIPGVSVNGTDYNAPMHLIAAAQMVSTTDKAHNLESAIRLVRRAADLGVRLVGLPENFSWMGPEGERSAAAETLEGPTLSRMAELA